MIKYYHGQGSKIKEIQTPQEGCWVNISPPFTENELVSYAKQFDVPTDFLKDSIDIDERSRYEREDDLRLIVVNTPILNEKLVESAAMHITVPIGIILGPEYIITLSSYENPVLTALLNGKKRNLNTADQAHFVLTLFEENVSRFLAFLKSLDHQRNHIEKELMDSSRNSELKQLLTIEKSLVYFVNTLSTNELLKMKMKRTDFLQIRDDEDKMDLFEDIIIDNTQALEMSNIYTNILGGTMEAYASIISNNLNVVIQRLTLVTIILMVPTLVASYYGMNVDLPFKNDPRAFYIIIILSLVFSLLLAWFFRSKRLF